VERALAVEDLSGPEGRDRAISAVAPVLGAMPMSVLRDELVRRVADRVDLAPERLWQMVEQRKGQRPAAQAGASRPAAQQPAHPSGAGNGAAAPVPAPAPVRAPLDPLAHAERNFLATCVALPSAGAELLDQHDPEELFASPLHRRAAAHLRAHLDAPEMGIPDDDPDLASVIAELLVRARTEVTNPTRAGLSAEMARLRVTMIDRAIREARRTGEGGVAALMAQKVELKRQIDAGAEDF
jgi:DNA primase